MTTKPNVPSQPETAECLAAMEMLKLNQDKIMQETTILSFKINSLVAKKPARLK